MRFGGGKNKSVAKYIGKKMEKCGRMLGVFFELLSINQVSISIKKCLYECKYSHTLFTQKY